MLIRVQTVTGCEVNINANNIVVFVSEYLPEDKTGNKVVLSNDLTYTVEESNRTLRHLIKVALAPDDISTADNIVEPSPLVPTVAA